MGLLESLDVYPKKARVSGSKRRVNKTINAGRRRTLLLFIETLCKWATSVAHLTNFSFEFFYEIFTEGASLLFLYHGAKK